jgi:integrase
MTRYLPRPDCCPHRRREVDRRAGIVNVRGTVSEGVIVELAKTNAGRRRVPLSGRASAALDVLPPRLETPLLSPASAGGLLDLDNFRRPEWAIAVETSGVATPARIYDLRSTFASNALAAGVTVFELAHVMGTSVRMIERHYGRCSTELTTSSPPVSTPSRRSSSRPSGSESRARGIRVRRVRVSHSRELGASDARRRRTHGYRR